MVQLFCGQHFHRQDFRFSSCFGLLFTRLSLAALVFPVAHRLSLVMASRSYSPVAAHRPPVLASSPAGSGAQVSVVLANGLGCPAACGFFIPRPGIEPMSPTLAGEFLTNGPLDHQGSSKAKLLLLDWFQDDPQCFIEQSSFLKR